MLITNSPSDNPFIEITAFLDVHFERKDEEKWERLANKTHYGSETIPLSVPSSEIPQVLKDVHWRIHAGKKAKIRFKLYANGSIEAIPIVVN